MNLETHFISFFFQRQKKLFLPKNYLFQIGKNLLFHRSKTLLTILVLHAYLVAG